jgi:hypothetical protein
MLVLWIIRFFIFRLYESPKYLMGRGRFKEAVEVVHAVAAYNGKTSDLTVQQLEAAGISNAPVTESRDSEKGAGTPELDTSAWAALRRQLEHFNADHVRALFATKQLAYSTTLVIIIWGISYVFISICAGY